MLAIDPISIDYAFKRLVTFSALNRDRPYQERVDALMLYCESVGMTVETVDYLHRLCERFFEGQGDAPSCAFIGLLLGLAAAEDLQDRSDTEE